MIRIIVSSLTLLLWLLPGNSGAAGEAIHLQLHVHPLPAPSHNAITLTVRDQRARTIPGLTVDGGAIRLDDDPATLLDQSATNALRQAGYRLVPKGNATGAHLAIALLKLTYRAHKRLMRTDIEATAELDISVAHDKRTLHKRFRAKSMHEVALTPSNAENTALLSEVLSHALEAAINDGEIRRAL